MKTFNSNNAPNAVGPYSHAVIYNNLIFLSGQIGLNKDTNELNNNTFEDEVRQVCLNIKNILDDANSSLDNVIKTTIYLTNINDFNYVNDIYSKYFKTKPARSCLEVSKLPKGARIEIEVIALINN